MARHLKHKRWVFKLFRALQKHYGSPSNRVNSILILVKDFWLGKMKCTCNFWALSCTPFPKVFLCFSLEQMFVIPKISLRRLTRGELDFPEVGHLLTGPQGSSTPQNRSRDPSAGCCPSCLLWILPSRFSKVGTLQSLSCGACAGCFQLSALEVCLRDEFRWCSFALPELWLWKPNKGNSFLFAQVGLIWVSITF